MRQRVDGIARRIGSPGRRPVSGLPATAAIVSSMKATRSRDGLFRVDVRVEFRVGIESAVCGIASQLYDDLVDVEDVSSLGRRRLEGALRDALHREGEHLAYVNEGYEDDGDWVDLVDAVRRRVIEVGLFPAEHVGAQPPSVREGSSDLGSYRRRGRPGDLFGDC